MLKTDVADQNYELSTTLCVDGSRNKFLGEHI